MEVFIAILVLIVAGLLATTRAAYRIRRIRPISVFIAGGWVSVLVGLSLGPAVTGLIERDTVFQAVPLLAIGLGWIGLLIGFQLRIGLLRSLSRVIYVSAITDILVCGAVFGAVAATFLAVWVPEPEVWTLLLPGAFIVTASLGWSVESRSLGTEFDERLMVILRAAGALSGVAAVLLFGLASKAVVESELGGVEFSIGFVVLKLLHSVALAVAIGLIGRFMLGLTTSRGGQFAIFLGIVAFVAGAAKQLDVSPLMTAMVVGAVITNLKSPDLREFEAFIFRAEHAFAILFGLLAGLLLQPTLAPEVLIGAGALIVARVVIKPIVLRYAARRSMDKEHPDGTELPVRSVLYFAAGRQSPLMLALGVSLVLLEPSAFHKELLWLMVLVGLFSEFPASIAARQRRIEQESDEPAPGHQGATA